MWSVVVITRNEADRIDACLASVRAAAATLVIDCGSEDDTAARARAAGAQVWTRGWTGYIDQRNAGIARVATPWVLFLDADERLAPGDDQRLTRWLEAVAKGASPAADGARVLRQNAWLGRPMRAGRFGRERLVRLGRVGACRWVGPEPHERLAVVGALRDAPITLLHEPYRDLGEHLEHQVRYAEQASRQGARRGGPTVRAALRFVDALLVRGGLADGWPGLAVAALGAASVWQRERAARARR